MNKNKTWFKWMNNAVLNEQWPADEGWPHAGVWRTASPHRMTRLCCRWPPEPSEQTQSHHSRGFRTLTCSGQTDSPAAGTDWVWCEPSWPLTSDPVALKQEHSFIVFIMSRSAAVYINIHKHRGHPEEQLWTVMNSFHPEVLRILRCSAAANSHIHLQILCFP